MKIIVGLGNPGIKYNLTRHNIGFMFLDFLASKFDFPEFKANSKFKAEISELSLADEKILLVKPLTYMNLSGETLVALKSFYKVENTDFLVVFDDVDLMFETVRFRESGSAGTHNGMRSILGLMGAENIPRLKLGIDSLLRKGDLASFVLNRFSPEEESKLKEIFENALAKLPYLT